MRKAFKSASGSVAPLDRDSIEMVTSAVTDSENSEPLNVVNGRVWESVRDNSARSGIVELLLPWLTCAEAGSVLAESPSSIVSADRPEVRAQHSFRWSSRVRPGKSSIAYQGSPPEPETSTTRTSPGWRRRASVWASPEASEAIPGAGDAPS